MKKLLHILYFVPALFALWGCVKSLEEPLTPVPEQDGKVTINGYLDLPMTDDAVWTKSFGEYSTDTKINHLYVAVFNEGDILQEVVEALPGTKEHPTDNFTPVSGSTTFKTIFHVTLTEAPARKRILHFIGTSKDRPDLLSANIMDESSYAKTLRATGDEDCYWGRQEYEFLAEDTEIKDIPMVRNFVKVKVKNDAENFVLKAFKVFNIPTSGSIAPFNPNTAEYTGSGASLAVNFNRFADYSGDGITYLSMSGSSEGQQHYEGYMPADVTYDNLSGLSPGYNGFGSTDAAFVAANFRDADEADYFYEATHYENDKNPFIIIQGQYTGTGAANKDTYYKVDFVYTDTDGEVQPYHLLRNFQYTLQITGVNSDGSSTILDAVNSIALNNFEASTQSQYLTNISDGDTRLFVSSTDKLIVRGDHMDMYVKSQKWNGSAWVNDNDNISVKAIKRISGTRDITPEDGSGITIGTSDVSYNETDGWRKVTINVMDVSTLNSGEVCKQRITFKNKGSDGVDATVAEKFDDLSRNLNLTMRQPFSLTVDVQDYVAGVAGSKCKVDFSIPSGFTEFRFPMTFYIEQSTNTLYPDYLADGANETLAVITGKSLIPGNTHNTYYYSRILSWEEYEKAPTDINGIKTFSSYLKSLVGVSKTDVWVFPDPENDYFDTWDPVNSVWTNHDTFDNSQAPGEITLERTSVLLSLESGRSTTVNLATANSGALVSYTSDNPSVVTVGINTGLLTAVATGTATITASCDEYGAYTGATKTFTVRVISEGGLDILWKSEPPRVLIPTATGTVEAKVVLGASTSQVGTTTYESSNTSVATIDASTGVVTALAAGTTVITATARAAVGGYDETFEQDISYTLTVAAYGDVPAGTVYHSEAFTNGTTGDYSVLAGESGDYVTTTGNSAWYANGIYGVTASSWLTDAFLSSEAWLSSKSFDLRAANGAVISFNHTANYFDNTSSTTVLDQMKHCLTLWYSVNGGEWVQIVIPDDQYPTGTSWVSQDTSIDLPAAVLGQADVRFAFKYVSDEFHGQWQIKDLTVTQK